MVEETLRPTNYSPLDPIRAIMVGAPGPEAVIGSVMPPEKSLFEAGDFDIITARYEHDQMQAEYDKHGIDVFNMRAILGEALAPKQHIFTSREQLLTEMKHRAVMMQDHYMNENHFKRPRDQIMIELEYLLDHDIATMGLDQALAINARLTNCIDNDGKLKKFDHDIPPIANFMFWRDTNHITGHTMGVHKMFWDIRQQEVELAKLGFDAIGLKYTQIHLPENNSIEGGDVLPMEINGQQIAMIGQLQRTSSAGVDAWFTLHEKQFSQSGDGLIPMVAEVIEMPSHADAQSQMHLDTHTQQFSSEGIIYCPEITDNRKLSILRRNKGVIERIDSQIFSDWIEKTFPEKYAMTRREQLDYAPNIVVDGGETVYITQDGTEGVAEFIQEHVTETVLLHMNHVTEMYGGAHCGSSEIRVSR
jgi:arginine deiminase